MPDTVEGIELHARLGLMKNRVARLTDNAQGLALGRI